jgi:hypothetical protein
MQNSIELARTTLGPDRDALAIRLDRDSGQEVIVLVWPTRPTQIAPRAFAATVTAIVSTLSEARHQLRLIRAAER